MGIGLLGRHLGLEALPGIKPRPSADAGPHDAGPNDPGTGAHSAQWRLLLCLLYALCGLLQLAYGLRRLPRVLRVRLCEEYPAWPARPARLNRIPVWCSHVKRPGT